MKGCIEIHYLDPWTTVRDSDNRSRPREKKTPENEATLMLLVGPDERDECPRTLFEHVLSPEPTSRQERQGRKGHDAPSLLRQGVVA